MKVKLKRPSQRLNIQSLKAPGIDKKRWTYIIFSAKNNKISQWLIDMNRSNDGKWKAIISIGHANPKLVKNQQTNRHFSTDWHWKFCGFDFKGFWQLNNMFGVEKRKVNEAKHLEMHASKEPQVANANVWLKPIV